MSERELLVEVLTGWVEMTLDRHRGEDDLPPDTKQRVRRVLQILRRWQHSGDYSIIEDMEF